MIAMTCLCNLRQVTNEMFSSAAATQLMLRQKQQDILTAGWANTLTCLSKVQQCVFDRESTGQILAIHKQDNSTGQVQCSWCRFIAHQELFNGSVFFNSTNYTLKLPWKKSHGHLTSLCKSSSLTTSISVSAAVIRYGKLNYMGTVKLQSLITFKRTLLKKKLARHLMSDYSSEDFDKIP